MNVLAEIPTTIPEPSGGDPLPASPVQAGSTPTELVLTPDQLGNFNVGDVVAVDVDYTGAIGYLGSGAPGTYLSTPVTTGSVIDFVRRITFNVSRVASITPSALLLAEPLLAAPSTGMGVQRVVAFVDREGSSYFQEWSGLFVIAPDSGGRSCFFYPRLQPAASGGPRRARNSRLRCSATCCTSACTPCRRPTATTARRCFATAAISRRLTQLCRFGPMRNQRNQPPGGFGRTVFPFLSSRAERGICGSGGKRISVLTSPIVRLSLCQITTGDRNESLAR